MCSVFPFCFAHIASTDSVVSVFFKSLFQSDHHPKTMPPLRPLPDLCLITLFKMMPPNDQMVGSQMSLRCAGLVRAANRTVKSLVITDKDVEYPYDLKDLKNQINRFSLASKPAMQPLIDIPGKPSFPDYPMTVSARLSKWHCLVVDPEEPIHTATTEQIVNIFSAVTDLKLCIEFDEYSETLLALLQHPNWQCQLTDLMVDTSMWLDGQQSRGLITAINGLTALQHLALFWHSDTDIPDLPILAQLKVVAFQSSELRLFLNSLERYATDNADLQVHLFSYDLDALLSLSQLLHSRIVRYESYFRSYLSYSPGLTPLLCSQFRSLTSLSIITYTVIDVVPLFTGLSQLHQLVHLGLRVDFRGVEELPPPRPLAQLNTVRALELDLSIGSHSQMQWLNLPVTMPNLYSNYIEKFYCECCHVQIGHCTKEDSSLLPSSSALNCLQSSLFTLHSGVPLNRLLFKGECISAEILLLQSASEPSVSTGQR